MASQLAWAAGWPSCQAKHGWAGRQGPDGRVLECALLLRRPAWCDTVAANRPQDQLSDQMMESEW